MATNKALSRLLRKGFSIEIISFLLFALVVLSNGMIVNFARGYFLFFEISLGNVNFSPQYYDYIRVALPVLLALAITILIAYFLLSLQEKIANKLASKINISRDLKIKITAYDAKHPGRFKHIGGALDKINAMLPLVTAFAVVAIMFFWSAPEIGRESAAGTSLYSSISPSGNVLQELVIYRSEDHIIVKTYDTIGHTFTRGYKLVSSEQSYTTYEIRK